MKTFREYSRGQMFLLRPLLDEFVPENHEARIINDAVEPVLGQLKWDGRKLSIGFALFGEGAREGSFC